MTSVNLVVMGKTGAGKSTLINTILKEDLAPTGAGSAVTKEVHKYSKLLDFHLLSKNEHASQSHHRMVRKRVNLYDTVGLEIDQAITKKTLQDIRSILDTAKSNEDDQDITLVWFCLSASNSRFESYEVELIRGLSIEYEIPFVVVITQCFSDERGALEQQIESDLPELTTIRILAKDYKLRSGTISAFGVDQLLSSSILDFNKRKVRILESKLNRLRKKENDRLESLCIRGKAIVEHYSQKAMKAAIIPVAGIPFAHGFCTKMIHDLNKLYGIKNSKNYSTEAIANTVVGVIATPLMAIPILSTVIAGGYVAAIGDTYLEALSCTVPGQSSSEDVMRILQELAKRKKETEE